MEDKHRFLAFDVRRTHLIILGVCASGNPFFSLAYLFKAILNFKVVFSPDTKIDDIKAITQVKTEALAFGSVFAI